MYEEHSALFGPAMSRLFGIAFPDERFMPIFVFPLIAPALEPANPAPIDAVIHGVRIEGMANHHLSVTGKYYFPGLYTAILPMIPGICAVWWMFRNRRAAPSAA